MTAASAPDPQSANRHARFSGRTVITLALPPDRPARVHAACWLLPWGYRTYPGRVKGLIELFGGTRAGWHCWLYARPRHGRTRRMPPGMLRRMATTIQDRCHAGLRLADELLVEAQAMEREPKRVPPWAVLDSVTGRDRRGAGARGVRKPNSE